MRRMLANFIFDYVNRCATKSKFVKFLMMASDDLWHMLYNTYYSVLQKHGWKPLFAQLTIQLMLQKIFFSMISCIFWKKEANLLRTTWNSSASMQEIHKLHFEGTNIFPSRLVLALSICGTVHSPHTGTTSNGKREKGDGTLMGKMWKGGLVKKKNFHWTQNHPQTKIYEFLMFKTYNAASCVCSLA